MEKPMTAAERRKKLSEQGITGPAQDLIIRATAAERAAWREAQVRKLAEAEGLPPWALWALCKLDEAGVGGTHDAEGRASARLPIFRKLGKGRKHASDGPAWSAAIAAVAAGIEAEHHELAIVPSAVLSPQTDRQLRPMLGVVSKNVPIWLLDEAPPRWHAAYAARQLIERADEPTGLAARALVYNSAMVGMARCAAASTIHAWLQSAGAIEPSEVTESIAIGAAYHRGDETEAPWWVWTAGGLAGVIDACCTMPGSGEPDIVAALRTLEGM